MLMRDDKHIKVLNVAKILTRSFVLHMFIAWERFPVQARRGEDI